MITRGYFTRNGIPHEENYVLDLGGTLMVILVLFSPNDFVFAGTAYTFSVDTFSTSTIS